MNQKENVASALGSILLGILLIVMKGKLLPQPLRFWQYL